MKALQKTAPTAHSVLETVIQQSNLYNEEEHREEAPVDDSTAVIVRKSSCDKEDI